MPVAPVTYHWAMSPLDALNPVTFHNYSTSINLPAGHTLRRVLLANTQFYWKRGSVTFEFQETYFANIEITYGDSQGAPILYRASRRIPSVIVSNALAVGDAVLSIHSAGDLEVGVNERVQRGGYYSGAVPLVLNFSITSSGDGQETLQGEAAMPLRALYSLPIPP